MDIATIVGLGGAFAMVVMAMGDPGPFVDVPSLLIVVLGTAFVVWPGHPSPSLLARLPMP
ncbi:MAG: hypothetical protein ACO3S9_07360 [Burkholderiaceae bacterium]